MTYEDMKFIHGLQVKLYWYTMMLDRAEKVVLFASEEGNSNFPEVAAEFLADLEKGPR